MTILHQAQKTQTVSEGSPNDTAHKALANIPETTKTTAEIEDRLIAARINMLLHLSLIHI